MACFGLHHSRNADVIAVVNFVSEIQVAFPFPAVMRYMDYSYYCMVSAPGSLAFAY